MADLFLIKKPWITEKAAAASAMRKYTFIVKNNATKNEVKKAVKELYKVDATSVNIINRGERKTGGARFPGHKPGFKKAIVTLKEGQSITIQ